jgi:UDP-N-acetylglucosamine 2-epimerase
VTRLLTDPVAYAAMQVDESPFGDGRASQRIVECMLELVETQNHQSSLKRVVCAH